MKKNREKGLFSRLSKSLDLVAVCRVYRLPLWQCPQFLFVVLGFVTVVTILIFYFTLSARMDPYTIALIAIGIAVYLLVQTLIIVHSFERVAEAHLRQLEFLNIASHQMREPVTVMRWAVDLLAQSSGNFSLETQHTLFIIRDAVHRLARLITALLGIVRIETGASSKRAETFPLNALVESAVESARQYARASNTKVELTAPKRILSVHADREQISFVLDRLLDNALRYSAGSSVISVRLQQQDAMAEVRVEDHGVGVPVKDQRNIFKKFFRASNAARLVPDGTGISLFVSRAVVESAGGRFGFQSSEKEGSIFWFVLPLV